MSALHLCQNMIMQLWKTREYGTHQVVEALNNVGFPAVDEAFVVYTMNQRLGRQREHTEVALAHYLSIARKIDERVAA